MSYSYSFSEEIARDWRWSEKYSAQAEIKAYLDHVADTLDVRKEYAFDTRVLSTVWNEDARRWTVTTDTGEAHTAQFVVAASGNLSVPKGRAEFAGLDEFAGDVYLTSRWPHEPVDFAGKRVGVVGTGSTGWTV